MCTVYYQYSYDECVRQMPNLLGFLFLHAQYQHAVLSQAFNAVAEEAAAVVASYCARSALALVVAS